MFPKNKEFCIKNDEFCRQPPQGARKQLTGEYNQVLVSNLVLSAVLLFVPLKAEQDTQQSVAAIGIHGAVLTDCLLCFCSYWGTSPDYGRQIRSDGTISAPTRAWTHYGWSYSNQWTWSRHWGGSWSSRWWGWSWSWGWQWGYQWKSVSTAQYAWWWSGGEQVSSTGNYWGYRGETSADCYSSCSTGSHGTLAVWSWNGDHWGWRGNNRATCGGACVAGKYQDSSGQAECKQCARGKYSTSTGQSSSSSCISCA